MIEVPAIVMSIGEALVLLALIVVLIGVVAAVWFEFRAGRRHDKLHAELSVNQSQLIGTLKTVGDNVVDDILKAARVTQAAAERTFEAIAKDGAETRKTIAEVHKSIKEELASGSTT